MATKKEEIFAQINKFHQIDNNIIEKLEEFVKILLNYNQKYNLIGKSTIDDIWQRHILDSAQLIKFIKDKNLILGDFGSGSGLPAIILSILGVKNVHLIEKSFRKCEFLEIARKTSENNITIHQKKAEEIHGVKFDIITSRAFAPLDKIIKTTQPFLKKDTMAILPKGKNIVNELQLIKKYNKINYEIQPSLTSKEGNILIINNFL